MSYYVNGNKKKIIDIKIKKIRKVKRKKRKRV